MAFCVKRCIIKRMRLLVFIKGFHVVINAVWIGLERSTVKAAYGN